jgi:hypothetical protein
LLADVHQARRGRGVVQQARVNQAVVQDNVRLHEMAQSTHRQQVRITHPGPDQTDMPGGRG